MAYPPREQLAATFWYVTAPSSEIALTIGRRVVAERLAASVNIIVGATSVYWWEGRLEEAGETVLTLRTRVELVERLTARSKQLHPYRCPAVVLAIAGGNPDYLDWVAVETAAARAGPDPKS